ncbi:hypothetical protein [Aquabacterium sp.]|uniref:hypothetical protein n=1 Tax=Aquabacterium sp. TaxID=1872578 RepID=UPI004037A40E
MTHPPFRLNEVIDNTADAKVLPGPCRVIGFCSQTSSLWLIALPERIECMPLRHRGYLKAPFAVASSTCEQWKASHQVYALQLQGTATLQLSDANLLGISDDRRRRRVERDLRLRDQRYEIVKTALSRPGTHGSMLTASDALTDMPRLREGIRRATKAHRITRTTARHLVHVFWAGGSQLNTLMPRFDRCGLRGHAKTSSKKLGRPPRAIKHGLTQNPGFVLDANAKDRIAWGYALVNRERTLRDAYLLMSSRYWADHSIAPSGEVTVTLHPPDQRPTYPQFIYWGRKLVKKKVKEVLLGPSKHRQTTEAHGGSVQDQVCMAGQNGQFDGTSTDLYLCSLTQRLKKLPAMTRSILKEVRCGLIVGIYAGWDAPSPTTALKTLLHAVDDKVAFCARFGITITADEWPSFLPRTILADNGEMKGGMLAEAERQFGFGIEYAPVHRGDRKGSVESQHHADHKRLDHKLPGNTKGRQRERGEHYPVVNALWNYYEYMQELIRHVLDHNNVEEVPDLAPADMLLADPPITPTRTNIYKWLLARNMVADVPVDVSAFRAFTLPDWPAVLHKNGVYLKADILGRTVRVARLRYSSKALVETGLMSRVKQSGSPMEVTVKFDREDLSRAWLVTPQGLIAMTLQVKDQTFVRKLTLTEWLMFLAESTLRSDIEKGQRDQYDMDRTLRRESITSNAKAEARQEEAALGGRPSKQSLKSNLRSNLAEEMALLAYVGQQANSAELLQAVEDKPTHAPPRTEPPPARRAGMGSIMAGLNEEEAHHGQ